MKKELTFEEIAMTLGMDESRCSISLSLPVIRGDVLSYRAYCLADLLVDRLIRSGEAECLIGSKKAEVKRILSVSDELCIALIHFEERPYLFPLALKTDCMTGNKHAIVQRLRKVEKELPGDIRAWSSIMRNGKSPVYDYTYLIRKISMKRRWAPSERIREKSIS